MHNSPEQKQKGHKGLTLQTRTSLNNQAMVLKLIVQQSKLGVGLQRGGKFPVKFQKLSKNSQKIPKNPGKCPNFCSVSEIYWKFSTFLQP